MPEILWNKIRIPSLTDMWDFITDLKKMGESVNAPIPVSSKAERDALTGPGGAAVPDGTVVVRLDNGGVLDIRIGGAWRDGDTGLLSSGLAITPAANFTITDYFLRRRGKNVSGRVQVKYTGPDVSSDSAGNFGDTTAFTLPAGWRPDAYRRDVQWQNTGVAQLFGGANTDGTVLLSHAARSSGVVLSSGTSYNAFLDYEIA